MPTKCDKIMDEYLALDKNQRVPLRITRHLLTCEACRNKIKMISIAEKQISAPLNVQTPKEDSSINAVMNKVAQIELENIRKHQLPVYGWIIIGVIMIALLVGATYFIRILNSNIATSFYALLLAFCIISYSAVFVYSHIDIFVKKIDTVVKGFQSAV